MQHHISNFIIYPLFLMTLIFVWLSFGTEASLEETKTKEVLSQANKFNENELFDTGKEVRNSNTVIAKLNAFIESENSVFETEIMHQNNSTILIALSKESEKLIDPNNERIGTELSEELGVEKIRTDGVKDPSSESDELNNLPKEMFENRSI